MKMNNAKRVITLLGEHENYIELYNFLNDTRKIQELRIVGIHQEGSCYLSTKSLYADDLITSLRNQTKQILQKIEKELEGL